MARMRGGDKLEAALRRISAGLSEKATLRVGFLEGATYPDGTPVAMAAAINEFGAPRARIPPRPAFRNMIAAKNGEWPGAIAGELRSNGYHAREALDVVGAGIAGQLRESIATITDPPLSPVTLMLRKWFPTDHSHITGKIVGQAAAAVAAGESSEGASTKPLVWSGHMLNSVGHEVVD